MAQQILTNTQIIVGSFDISSFADMISVSETASTVEQTTFGSGGFRVVAESISDYAVGIEGFSDFAATGTAPAFPASALGTQYGYMVNPTGGTTAGDPSQFGRGILSSYTPFGGSVGESARFVQAISPDSEQINGYLLAPLASRGAFTGSSVTMAGPTATQRVWAALNISGAVGTNLSVVVQSAPLSNFASPTTRFTFSTVSAVGWQMAAPVSGPITDGFWRATATVGSSTFTWACSIGISRL